MKRMKYLVVICCCFLAIGSDLCTTEALAQREKTVFDYTLYVDDRAIASSKESGPVTYMHGEKTILPALAKEIEEMETGERKKNCAFSTRRLRQN